MAKRSIKIEFLNVPDFFVDEETREIDEDALVSEIRSVNPRVIIMMICYSHFLAHRSKELLQQSLHQQQHPERHIQLELKAH